MRKPDAVYDNLLRLQADLSFDMEMSYFRTSSRWNEARSILDFGAGNGYYANRLADRFPDKHFTCVELDPLLADHARRWTARRDVHVITGTFTDVPDTAAFDFVLARVVLSYLPDRSVFLRWLYSHTREGAGVLVVDADDSQLHVAPRLPLLEAGNERFKGEVHASGGDRDLKESLQQELDGAGFRFVRASTLVVHSDLQARRELMYSFVLAVAEHDHGSPVPPLVRDEIDSWLFNPDSYFQYGLYISEYERTGA